MDKEKSLSNGGFCFKALPDDSLYKNRVICICCWCELSYRWSTSGLKFHLLAKLTVDAENPPPPSQTKLDSWQWRSLDNSTRDKLSTAIAKWLWFKFWGKVSIRRANIARDSNYNNAMVKGEKDMVSLSFLL